MIFHILDIPLSNNAYVALHYGLNMCFSLLFVMFYYFIYFLLIALTGFHSAIPIFLYSTFNPSCADDGSVFCVCVCVCVCVLCVCRWEHQG
jgi:hypothetical protein